MRRFNLGDAVVHFGSKRKGTVVANSSDGPFVVIEFLDGSSEVLHKAELRDSDHLINPEPAELANRINLLIEDSHTREIAGKEFGLEQGDSLMSIEFLPLSHEMEITTVKGTKIASKKVSIKHAKSLLTIIENKVS